MGGVLYSTSQKKCLDNQGMLVKTDREITPEITRITGITKKALDRFGYDESSMIETVIDMMNAADAVIGYNCRRFDRNVFAETCARAGEVMPDKVWIDLFMDLPWNVPTGKLSHVAADHGFLNLFPHSALSDAQTVLGIAQQYDSQMLFERAKSPSVIICGAHDRSQNDLVKAAKFRWNPERKVWWKAIKMQDVDAFVAQLPFHYRIAKELSLEELE